MKIKKINNMEELKNPEMKSYDYAEMMIKEGLPEITEGTEKQIKYAADLRNDFLGRLVHREIKANVRWIFINNEDTKNYQFIAEEAVNRIKLRKMITNDAKEIINVFCDPDIAKKQDSAKIRFLKILEGKEFFN